jgi:hypothetical protein
MGFRSRERRNNRKELAVNRLKQLRHEVISEPVLKVADSTNNINKQKVNQLWRWDTLEDVSFNG